MNFLSQDIEDIIISYKKDLEHAENKKRVIEQINQINIIYFCDFHIFIMIFIIFFQIIM